MCRHGRCAEHTLEFIGTRHLLLLLAVERDELEPYSKDEIEQKEDF